MRQATQRFFVTLVLCVAVLAVGSALAQVPGRPVPTSVSYQGRLSRTDGTVVPDGTYALTFKLYDRLSGGTPRWEEKLDQVVVRNGVFSVLLGTTSPLRESVFANPEFLEVQINDEAPLRPRMPIAAVPFALRTETARKVVDGAITTPKLADGAVTAAKLAGDSASLSKLTRDTLAVAPGTEWLPHPLFTLDSTNRSHRGLYIDHAGFGGTPSITFAVGDTDTGLRWLSDGEMDVCSNGQAIAATKRNPERLEISPRAYIHNGFGGAPNYTLTIGDSDTGINWAADGALDFYTDGHKVAELRSDRFSVVGGARKEAVVDAARFGQRAMYAVESPEVRFSDEGTARLQGGRAVVRIDPMFLETVEGTPTVHLTPYGDSLIYVAQVSRDQFVVRCGRGAKDVTFAWQVSYRRKGFGDVRMEPR
jgi:hypothetical protein